MINVAALRSLGKQFDAIQRKDKEKLNEELWEEKHHGVGIHYAIPKIDRKVIMQAQYSPVVNKLEAKQLLESLKDRHPSYALTPSREKSLEEFVYLYKYFQATKKDEPEYKHYLDTMNEMVNRKGLITGSTSQLPMGQFTAKTIERISAEVLNKLYPKKRASVYDSGGRQDDGVDLIMGGKFLDVKTYYQSRRLDDNSILGTIKHKALSDNTKKTDTIVWTANYIEKGYVVILGAEKWNKVKQQILDGDGWVSHYNKEGGEDYYTKKLADFEGLSFDKRHMNGYTKEEYENRTPARREYGR